MNSYLKTSILSVSILLTLLSGIALAKENEALSAKHQKLIKAFPEVDHLSSDEFNQMEKDNVVIFDVRKPDEYEVSHIEKAIWVSPKISSEDFLEKYSDELKDKTVILYCSVGHRSSVLAEKIQDGLFASGSEAVYNLEGGLFKWHNDNLPLVTEDAQPTDFIHPYNFYWGRMVNQKSKKRYELTSD